MRLRSNNGQYVCKCGTEIAHMSPRTPSTFGPPESLEARSARSLFSPAAELVLDARLHFLKDDPNGLPWYGLPARALRRLAPHERALRGGSRSESSFLGQVLKLPDLGEQSHRGPPTLSLPAHLIASCPDRRCRHRNWEIDTSADSG